MENVLFENYNNIITPPESLTPNSITDSNEIISFENTFKIEENLENKDAYLLLNEREKLVSPPPPSSTIQSKSSKDKSVLGEHDINKDKPPMIEDGCKWCQRCGTVITPRWRYGPGGPLTLCNACHLRWKTLGKPIEGYSSENYPPPFYDPNPKTLKRKWTKKTKQVEVKRKRLASPSPPPTTLTKTTTTTTQKKFKEDIPNISICTQCHTTQTSQWRRGPLGHKTLCNACGLKWAKQANSSSNSSSPSSPMIDKSIVKEKPKKVPNSTLLHQKKEYVKRGLYSKENRIETLDKSPFEFSFPLPIHLGEYLLSKEREFELPCDILQERELGLIKGLMADREPFFTRIRSNIFVERKPIKSEEQAICHCVPPKDINQKGCGEDCINRMLFYECDPKHCPCGSRCSNQRFQRKEKKKGLQIFQSNGRGWGLKTIHDIKKGELVIEYRGEIISYELCEERMCTTYVNEKNFYFLDYCNGEVIDACTKGTEARFINHSCDPNCHIEKWSLKGESHFGVFASVDIKANSELFYDYNFSTFNDSVEGQQICYCGSDSCRGTIGRRSKTTK